MGPPSHMRTVVDRNVVMGRMTSSNDQSQNGNGTWGTLYNATHWGRDKCRVVFGDTPTHAAGQERKNLAASVTKTRISLKGLWTSQILTLSLYLPLTSSASLPGPGNSPPWYHPVELLQVVVTSRGRQSNETPPARKKNGSFNHTDHSFTIWRVNVL